MCEDTLFTILSGGTGLMCGHNKLRVDLGALDERAAAEMLDHLAHNNVEVQLVKPKPVQEKASSPGQPPQSHIPQ